MDAFDCRRSPPGDSTSDALSMRWDQLERVDQGSDWRGQKVTLTLADGSVVNAYCRYGIQAAEVASALRFFLGGLRAISRAPDTTENVAGLTSFDGV